jgi:chemotaxis regulatin CheY-phosphate phosphatase CheZ
MGLRILEIQEKNLDNLFEAVSKLEEDEIKAHLAKYLCIQASGYLENVIKELIAEYHDGTCKKSTANFVNDKLKNFTNISDDKLLKFLKSFNAEWETQFNEKVSERHLSSLTSIISQRNQIAHGNANRSNISYKTMVQYYTDLKEIVKILRTIIDKNNKS